LERRRTAANSRNSPAAYSDKKRAIFVATIIPNNVNITLDRNAPKSTMCKPCGIVLHDFQGKKEIAASRAFPYVSYSTFKGGKQEVFRPIFYYRE
jgi:hypothetical protein